MTLTLTDCGTLKRKLGIGEKLPYHKRDWPSVADEVADPFGYQQSDSFPIQTTYGPTIVQTYDFGNNPRTFGQFDEGDGGQIAFFSSNTASMGLTEDVHKCLINWERYSFALVGSLRLSLAPHALCYLRNR